MIRKENKMKKIIPFKKDIIFKSNVSEIISIALEHSLIHKEGNIISGEFIINGEYKITDTSTTTEKFNFNIPFLTNMDDFYTLDNVTIDIDDFYYEIVNSSTLSVNIDILVDHLEEKVFSEERKETKLNNEEKEIKVLREQERETIKEEEREEDNTIIKSIFDNFEEEPYSTYNIHIVREQDTLEEIILKYETSREDLEQYNNLNDIKLGDKIIIPSKKDA